MNEYEEAVKRYRENFIKDIEACNLNDEQKEVLLKLFKTGLEDDGYIKKQSIGDKHLMELPKEELVGRLQQTRRVNANLKNRAINMRAEVRFLNRQIQKTITHLQKVTDGSK